MAIEVRRAGPADDDSLARLFALYAREYAYSLGDQDVVGEGQRVREYYAGGAVLVAVEGDDVIGCVCFEEWGPGRARMKRMVVDPSHRGRGVGRMLAEAIVRCAAAMGYSQMCLDTTRPMTAATNLYQSLGFEVWEPDYVALCRDTVYMRRDLTPA